VTTVISQEREAVALSAAPAGPSLANRLSGALPRGRLAVALTLLALILAFALVGPLVIGITDPLLIVGGLYDAPSTEHLLGTDNFGRDVLAQLMYGTRNSLVIGGIAGLSAVLIGVSIGTTAGFRGGFLEEGLMALTNVVITIPSLVVLILLSIAIGTRSIATMGLIIGVTSWPWTARAVRAQTSSLRTRSHVDIARLSGANTIGLIL